MNFKKLDHVLGEVKSFGMPKLYKDPGERENVLFPNTWVPRAARAPLIEHAISLKNFPPIKPDPYTPQK
jgi:hypothetical protein